MARLEAEFSAQPARFAQLKPCLTGDDPDRYRDIAASLGLSGPARCQWQGGLCADWRLHCIFPV